MRFHRTWCLGVLVAAVSPAAVAAVSLDLPNLTAAMMAQGKVVAKPDVEAQQ